MLQTMSVAKFWEWMAYSQLEPFGERRADNRAAMIASTIANVHRGKHQRAFSAKDFMLKYDDDEGGSVGPRQSWQQQKMIARMWALSSTTKEKKQHGRNHRRRNSVRNR